jgi:hypothetical protein
MHITNTFVPWLHVLWIYSEERSTQFSLQCISYTRWWWPAFSNSFGAALTSSVKVSPPKAALHAAVKLVEVVHNLEVFYFLFFCIF